MKTEKWSTLDKIVGSFIVAGFMGGSYFYYKYCDQILGSIEEKVYNNKKQHQHTGDDSVNMIFYSYPALFPPIISQ